MNQLKAGAILSYVSLALSNIIGLLYTPYMLRMMGQSEYGLYSLIASVVAYLTVLDMGFGSAVIRYTAKFKAQNKIKEQCDLFGMFILLYAAIGILSFLIGLVLLFNVELIFGNSMSIDELQKARIMILFMIFNISITFPLSVFGSIITAYEKFIFQKIIIIIRIVLNPLVMVVLLSFGYKAIGMVIVTTLFNITTLLINWWYAKYKLRIKINFGGFDIKLLREILGFSIYVFVLALLDQFYFQFSNLALGALVGTAAVSIFAISLQLRGYLGAFSGAISGVFLPKITNMVTNRVDYEQISNLFIRVSRLQFYIVALIFSGFILFGKSFILLWVGEEFIISYYAALIIMAPFTVSVIQNMYYPISQALNKQKELVYIYICVVLITIGSSLVLIPKYNVLGAAFSIAIASIIGEIVLKNYVFIKVFRINIIQFWKEILKIFCPILILDIVVYFITCNVFFNWKNLILIISGYSIMYFLTIYICSFNQYEKNIFIKPVFVFFKLNKK